jgi:hypothetical protein
MLICLFLWFVGFLVGLGVWFTAAAEEQFPLHEVPVILLFTFTLWPMLIGSLLYCAATPYEGD